MNQLLCPNICSMRNCFVNGCLFVFRERSYFRFYFSCRFVDSILLMINVKNILFALLEDKSLNQFYLKIVTDYFLMSRCWKVWVIFFSWLMVAWGHDLAITEFDRCVRFNRTLFCKYLYCNIRKSSSNLCFKSFIFCFV